MCPATRNSASDAPQRSGCEVADIFRTYGSQYRAEHRLSPAQAQAMRAIEQCRTAALGGHLEQCDACQATRPVYNSCRNRHCPKCQALAQAQWREAQQAKLLPVPYYHVVFTIPHGLNALLRCTERLLYSALFQTAIATLKKFARDPKHLGAELGVTAVLHTWGQNLSYHVHLHCIVTGGGLSPEGEHWVTGKKRRFLFPVHALAKVFQGKFRARLKAAYRAGKLAFQGDCGLFQNPVEWQRLLATLRRKKWIVYAKAPLAGPQQVLTYLSRYTHRIAIANHRILDCRDGLVRFRYKDYAHDQAVKEMTLSATEFIRRFLLHILPSGFMRIRHYGLLANRRREEKLARCRALLGCDAAPPAVSEEESTPERVARLTGIALTRCTVCGAGPMRLVERFAPRPQDTS